MEFHAGRLSIVLKRGDVFLKIPLVGILAWNSLGVAFDSWKTVIAVEG